MVYLAVLVLQVYRVKKEKMENLAYQDHQVKTEFREPLAYQVLRAKKENQVYRDRLDHEVPQELKGLKETPERPVSREQQERPANLELKANLELTALMEHLENLDPL